MTRAKQIALGVGVGSLAGLILGAWGSAAGLRGMAANAVGTSLLPLAAYLVVKARRHDSQVSTEDAPQAPPES